MSVIRENWRIGLLVVLLLVSTVALFVPGAPPGTSANETAGSEGQLTNLQYGIELSGGARLQPTPVGMTAEGITIGEADTNDVRQSVADQLGVEVVDVEVRRGDEMGSSTIEVFTEDLTESEFRNALTAEGYEPSTVREGVTDETIEALGESVRNKLEASATNDVRVEVRNPPSGRQYLVITAPDREPEEIREVLEQRGIVQAYAYYPAENGTYVREKVLEQDAITGTGPITREERPGGEVYVFTATIGEGQASDFANKMTEAGAGDGMYCSQQQAQQFGQQVECLQVQFDGEIVFNGTVQPDLGRSYQDGSFTNDPTFTISTPTRQEAQQVKLSLDAGRLPAPLEFGNTLYLSPALADQFKMNSLITGLLSVLAVSLVVYGRYGRPEVAFPMIVTALSEVYILLGFVALVQFPLDLSHLAGFIAVIGTGVDDLIIIGDEILQQGNVATGRVFQSRFRKAFWVIGAAAATTIVAMTPLIAFGLDQLAGFAIITIAGVLIGVLITRPAYGDILRNLVLDE